MWTKDRCTDLFCRQSRYFNTFVHSGPISFQSQALIPIFLFVVFFHLTHQDYLQPMFLSLQKISCASWTLILMLGIKRLPQGCVKWGGEGGGVGKSQRDWLRLGFMSGDAAGSWSKLLIFRASETFWFCDSKCPSSSLSSNRNKTIKEKVIFCISSV